MSNASLSADITTFRLVLGSFYNREPQRSVCAMLALHQSSECPLELDLDVNPYGIPFHAKFQPGMALLPDGSPMPDGCGAFGFVAPFISRYADIEPVEASLEIRISLPEADFEALWLILATGRPDLVATISFSAGPFKHVLPPCWRWDTATESYLRVDRANVAFSAPGWPTHQRR